MEEFLSICLGIGLAAACGFRVFVPMLIMSAAHLSGHLPLASQLEWIGSWPAFICFLVATVVEIIGYYIPWIDNTLDAVAGPAAMIAGAISVAAVLSDDVSPLFRWTIGIIAGGGTALSIQTLSMSVRGLSTATTGGSLNFIVSSIELLLSIMTTIGALIVPVLVIGILITTCWLTVRWLRRRRQEPKHESYLAKECA
jgi:hypothetical protein